mmetsp:Transcript_52057/g.77754  ORF Transcript_52057/g.77754 Transcript_52057/m.77754 type:complete len:95 (+) Transcript_52057:514-798(+)
MQRRGGCWSHPHHHHHQHPNAMIMRSQHTSEMMMIDYWLRTSPPNKLSSHFCSLQRRNKKESTRGWHDATEEREKKQLTNQPTNQLTNNVVRRR